MSEKPATFTVTDRRKFTLDGELRDPASSVEEEVETPAPATPAPEAADTLPAPDAVATPAIGAPPIDSDGEVIDDANLNDRYVEGDLGPLPTSQESAAQHAAYQQTSGQIDNMIRQANPGAPPSIEMDFEQVVQSIYLSAAVAMGAATEPGQQPRIDIIGARQSIDMLAVLVEKTKGNLTEREEKLLQTALFNLRMTFVEITNTIAAQATKAPKPGSPSRTS